MTEEVVINIRAIDEFSQTFNDLGRALKKAKGTLIGMGAIATGVFAGTVVAIKKAISATMEYESLTNRLTHILNTSRGATEEQISVLIDQQKALEKVGVASKENISITQSQLATFDMEIDSIKSLTPAILDYVIAEKGANATTEDFKQMTNGLAQALNGNFTSLTKTGFILDDVTKDLIKNGTEAEKTAAIVRVLNSTYKGFNEEATKTAEGGLVILKREIDNVFESIGNNLLPIFVDIVQKITPIIQKITEWIELHPKLASGIIIATLLISGIIAVVVALTLAIMALTLVSWPVVAVVLAITLAIGALIGIGYLLYKNWGLIQEKGLAFWQFLKDLFAPQIAIIKIALDLLGMAFKFLWDNYIGPFWDKLQGLYEFLNGAFMTVLGKIVDAFKQLAKFNASAGDKITSGYASAKGSVTSVGDAIIRPNGDIIKTHPNDTLIATQGGLGGGTSITITGNIYGTDPDEIADAIMLNIRRKVSI
jgi:hypothetical protein